MKDFDYDFRRSDRHRLSQTTWVSAESDENDPANCRPGLWSSAVKDSGSRKITSPVKKVLSERNGSDDMDGSVQTLKLQQPLVSEFKEVEPSLSPYDRRFKSYLRTRPKFLRYRPDRQSEIFTLLRDKKNEREIGRGLSFGDEGEKYSDIESEEDEKEEEEEGSDGMKGLIKKLALFVLFLFSTSYLYHIDVSEVPAEGIDKYEIGFSSWPAHNFTYEAVSENEGDDVDSMYVEHNFLSSESECADGNEETLGKVEEEIMLHFQHDHPWPEFEELRYSVIQNSRMADDKQENTARLEEAHEVQLKSEAGNDLATFDSPTTESSHFEPGEIIDEKEYPTQAELETPKAQDWKIASVRVMIIFSLSVPFLIASSLFLGMPVKRRSSPSVFQSQVTLKPFNSQPVYHNSAELQSPKEYQTVPHTCAEAPSTVYPKKVENARLAPGVELLGEFTFGGRCSSSQSNTVTKLHNAMDEQRINFISKEKSVLETSEPEFIKSPSQGRNSSTFAKRQVDKGTNESSGSTPTPLRRSSRLRNREAQSP